MLHKIKGNIFSSLRWKIAFITGSVLFLIHGAFSIFAIYSLEKQSAERINDLHLRHQVLLSHLINQSHYLLQQIAETIPLIAENINSEDNAIINTIDSYWLSYLITWEIESIQYFSNDGSIVKKWGISSRFPVI